MTSRRRLEELESAWAEVETSVAIMPTLAVREARSSGPERRPRQLYQSPHDDFGIRRSIALSSSSDSPIAGPMVSCRRGDSLAHRQPA
jgi:hypothetical protein